MSLFLTSVSVTGVSVINVSVTNFCDKSVIGNENYATSFVNQRQEMMKWNVSAVSGSVFAVRLSVTTHDNKNILSFSWLKYKCR